MSELDWLQWYRGGKCVWHHIESSRNEEKKTYFARQLGIVESSFDDDGRHHVGRADVNTLMTFQLPKSFDGSEIRERVKAVWSVLRAHHILMRAQAVEAGVNEVLKDTQLEGRCFLIKNVDNVEELDAEAEKSIVFLEDFYDDIDVDLFLRHIANTARCFDSSEGLCKLFVVPLKKQSNGQYMFRAFFVLAHMITDGVSTFNLVSHFENLLNFSVDSNRRRLQQLAKDPNTAERLPPAQEELYPPVFPENLARSRWRWAISRILRHSRKPPPNSFANPLRRTHPRSSSVEMPRNFDKVLDYSTKPPLNSFYEFGDLSPAATKRMLRLCREANVSFGAGCFTLVGIAMMEMYEEFYPSVPLEARLQYVVNFPVNPRPFFDYSDSRDHGSCMLAFGDGVAMPFLPSELPIEGRFKVLAKQTHRQLNVYQKKPREAAEVKKMGARNAAELIPSTYISTVERLEAKRPPAYRKGINPQGAYPAAVGNGFTNGVTASGLRKGMMAWGGNELSGSADEHVEFVHSVSVVRVRDDEFLVWTGADPGVVHIGVSFDGNYIDEEKAKRWRDRMVSILEPDPSPNL